MIHLQGAQCVGAEPPSRLRVELRNGNNVLLDLEELIQRRDAYWRLR